MKDRFQARRAVLVSGVALAVAAKIGPGSGAAHAAPEAAPLNVRVTIGSKSYEFDETKGRDLGDYEGPGFVQRCVMCTVPDLPLSVFMRPDRNSDRVEVVFELARMWNTAPQPLGAYVAEIGRGSKQLARVEVPRHFWLSRWRWQSARRPVIAKAASLIASGMVPPYAVGSGIRVPPLEGREAMVRRPSSPEATAAAKPQSSPPHEGEVSGLPGASPITGTLHRDANGELEVTAAAPAKPAPVRPPPAAPKKTQAQPHVVDRDLSGEMNQAQFGYALGYSIMGLAGLAAYMPTTGERDEIGPVTEQQARWICTEASDALEEMLAQAEASGTIPWHMRDERTGAPFDFNQYPKAGWAHDTPHLCNPYVPWIKSPVTPDDAHHPALTYLPFLLTGDPYYLEALQLQLTWCIGSVVGQYRLDNTCILPYGQTRSFAWCLRDLAQLVKLTPVKVPGWFKPRSYWAQILENNRAWFYANFVRNPDPPFRVFRVATKVRTDAQDPGVANIPRTNPYEEDYLAFILGWLVLMGFSSWREAFEWKVGHTIGRTSSTSGWERAMAAPYIFCLSGGPSAPLCETWKEAWDANARLQKWNITDPNHFVEPNTGYLSFSRAVLALALRHGISEAQDGYSWSDNVIRVERREAIVWRWIVSA
jgi:hypothetical protein